MDPDDVPESAKGGIADDDAQDGSPGKATPKKAKGGKKKGDDDDDDEEEVKPKKRAPRKAAKVGICSRLLTSG